MARRRWRQPSFGILTSLLATNTGDAVMSGCWRRGPSFRTSVCIQSLRISSPLVDDGVLASENLTLPLLLYCPGLDGSRASGFVQLPKLGESFDVRVIEASRHDRSDFASLVQFALRFLTQSGRPFYLLGESFGALVALRINHEFKARGVVLVNPATSYRRSRLRHRGPSAALFFGSDAVGFAIDLVLIVSGRFLPPAIDSVEREAYMGRFASSLPQRLSLGRATLEWRMREWLDAGTATLVDPGPDDQLIVVVGERDEALPSVDEALTRFAKFPSFVVPGASHGTTLGVRCDLANLIRLSFFGDDIQPRFGLVRRKHPRVDPRLYDSFRARKPDSDGTPSETAPAAPH